MSGEQKFLLMIGSIVIICITIVYGFLFVSLWAYKEWVGLSAVAFLALLAYVYVRGKLIEQDLLKMRSQQQPYAYPPLDMQGGRPKHEPIGLSCSYPSASYYWSSSDNDQAYMY